MALATPNQLYRLNKLGRLTEFEGTPLTHADADKAIKRAMGTCCGDPVDCVCGGTALDGEALAGSQDVRDQ